MLGFGKHNSPCQNAELSVKWRFKGAKFVYRTSETPNIGFQVISLSYISYIRSGDMLNTASGFGISRIIMISLHRSSISWIFQRLGRDSVWVWFRDWSNWQRRWNIVRWRCYLSTKIKLSQSFSPPHDSIPWSTLCCLTLSHSSSSNSQVIIYTLTGTTSRAIIIMML